MSDRDIYREHESVERWKGSIADILALGEYAQGLVAEATPHKSPPYDVHGSFHLKDGRESPYRGQDALAAQLRRHDLKAINMLSIWVGEANDGVAVLVNLYQEEAAAQGAVTLTVYGNDGVAVAGLAKRMRETLDRGKRQVGIPENRIWPLFLAALALVPVGFVLSTFNETLAFACIAAAGVLFVSSLAALYVVPLIIPRLELSETDESVTRAERLKLRAGQLGLFVGGAVVYAIVNKVIA